MIRAILFDKDGTFTDFRQTWERWMPGPIRELARETGAPPDVLADVIGFDLEAGVIRPDGRFVTATNAETGAAIAELVGWDADRIRRWWDLRVMEVEQVPVTDLAPLLHDIAGRGLALGVLTNADESEARIHLAHLGILDHFAQVIGYDSGWGAKPGHHGALAFAEGLGLRPQEVVVVGDGMTDMLAAKGAGMRAVAVLTGTLDHAALAPHAEVVLPDVSHLPAWLDAQEISLQTA
ncbi:HAD family hydrolase [Jannaschia sp. 2305UL9-9]|uniref:HAD family hydrolase n=1 Tax=Jannaschia sp. 2305UL9-9 TaxID=3121638 RepID=UPI0035281DE2